ncbi:unnamed protein product [Allacma fusca]|uniref:Peptidase S1 domain-containing protein n=1 Tax=Allacma fusca TaxID=39272 RepID=A0A8J2JH76_9HEXA|nr:unnamed protein product [Allacma fusca]
MFNSKGLITLLGVFTMTSGLSRRRDQEGSPLIIGGDNAGKNEFPYQLSFRLKGQEHLCGASLISEHVLSSDDGTEQTRSISQWVIHEDYNVITFANDIAILKLASPFTLNDQVKAVNLPLAGYKATGSGVISGWGSTARDGAISDILRKNQVQIHSDSECERLLGSKYEASMICAGSLTGGADFCDGDDGGPLTLTLDNQPLLAGVASALSGCGQPNNPGIYTEVAHFTQWIRANMN